MKIVTAISDSESEELVTSLLFSQGFEIAFRALSLHSLYNFINNQEDSFVVIYDHSFESKLEFRKSIKLDSQHRYIRFEPKKFNPAMILSEISSFKHNYFLSSNLILFNRKVAIISFFRKQFYIVNVSY